MMKKNGFTLAEVLITLAIIGVVAVMTLPALMANTQEQQARTAYKKLVTSLTQAGEMSAAKHGSNFSGVNIEDQEYDNSISAGDMTLAGLIHDELSVNDLMENAEYTSTNEALNHCADGVVYTLRDQTAICLGDAEISGTNPPYITIWVDTNGPKGPNRESSCGGNEEGCKDRNTKAINDQFPVTLYEGSAYPGHWTGIFVEKNDPTDRAARYAYDQIRQEQAGGGN